MNTDDPILNKIKSVSTSGLEYLLSNYPSEKVNIIDATIYLLWLKANFSKTVRPSELITNVQFCFRSEELQSSDEFWKQHCSSSLRELVDRGFETNCRRFFTFIPKREDGEYEKHICDDLRLYKDFLNDYAHFNANAVNLARQILKQPDLNDIENSQFDKICEGFVSTLYSYLTCHKK